MALSIDLNRRVLERPIGGVGPFLFKVGSMKRCSDRIASLNENRKAVLVDGITTFLEPAYAGAVDWRILRCREVSSDRYDDRVFKTWLRENCDPRDVRSIDSVSFTGIDGLSPLRRFRDLCFMSEDYVRRRSGVRVNDPLHREMLAAVAGELVHLVDGFTEKLDVAVGRPSRARTDRTA